MTTSSVDLFFKQMGRYDVLEKDVVIELSRKVRAWQDHDNGPAEAPGCIKRIGLAARDKLVRHNLRLVVNLWRRKYQNRIAANDPGLADALQQGAAGLVRAAEKYDATTGYTFATYATTWIHKGFMDYIANETRLVRVPAHNSWMIKAAIAIQTERKANGEDELPIEELREQLASTRKNVPNARTLKEWMEAWTNTLPRSFSEVVGEDMELGDTVADSHSTEDLEDELLTKAQEAVRYLRSFDRKVLEHRFAKGRGGVGRRRVARTLKCTIEEVAQAEERGLKQLHAHVNAW